MHCSNASTLSRASVMLVTVLALFTSVCIGVPAAGSSAKLRRADPVSGEKYTVAAKETCNTIAHNHHVSTNDIIALNCLDSECRHLEAGRTILLPGSCDTYNVKQGDTCDSIVSTHNHTHKLILADFYAFNPTINRKCSNLDTDTNVCLTAPQGTPFNAPPCPS